MPFDVKAFLAQHSADLPPEDQAELNKAVLAGSDYQRSMNKLKADYDARMAQEDAFREELIDYEQKLNQRFAQTQNPNVVQNTATGNYMRIDDVKTLVKQETDALLAKVAPAIAGTFSLVQKMPGYVEDYRTEFNKRFPANEFIKFCEDNNIQDPDLGYKLYTADDRVKAAAEKHAADITAAEERGARAARSALGVVGDYGHRPTVQSPLMRQPSPRAVGQPAPAFAAPIPAPTPMPVIAAPMTAVNIANAVAGANPNLPNDMQRAFIAALGK